ncbi:hypothetical protein HDU79_005796 [Rhizoclosmatium sp. JEL0117]|nr:hypothetical protein HDU79_005796 [Rhizoclosmatium sp. JEL0117]
MISIPRRSTTPFECPKCDKSFLRIEHLNRHLKCTHDGVKEFHCKVCQGSFGRNDELLRHLRMHVRKNELDISEIPTTRTRRRNIRHPSLVGLPYIASKSNGGVSGNGSSGSPSPNYSDFSGPATGSTSPLSPPFSPGYLVEIAEAMVAVSTGISTDPKHDVTFPAPLMQSDEKSYSATHTPFPYTAYANNSTVYMNTQGLGISKMSLNFLMD